jgi:hypothetical protein
LFLTPLLFYEINIWENTNVRTITTGKGKFSANSLHIVKVQLKKFVKNNSKEISANYLRSNAEIVREGYLNRLQEMGRKDTVRKEVLCM